MGDLLTAIAKEAGIIALLGWVVAILIWREYRAQTTKLHEIIESNTEGFVALRQVLENHISTNRDR